MHWCCCFAVGIGQPAAWRRVKRLTDQGVIAGRRVVLDPAALGFGVTVFLGVKLAAKGRTSLEDFERAVTAEQIGKVKAAAQTRREVLA